MVTGALFALFLVYPTVRLLLKSILSENGMTMEFYHSVLTQKGFLKALENSFLIAGVSALLTTGLAFFWPTPFIIQISMQNSKKEVRKRLCFRCSFPH